MGPAPKWHFVLGLPNASPKIPKVGTLATVGLSRFWGPITLHADLQLG
jgi:hypothetical protein